MKFFDNVINGVGNLVKVVKEVCTSTWEETLSTDEQKAYGEIFAENKIKATDELFDHLRSK